jgi:hypothetical protein
MPDLPPARRRRAPSGRRFAAGALASAVAVFGVLALRVHAGDDPALGATKAKAAAADTTTTTSSSSTVDPYAAPTTSDDDQSSSAAAAPTTRAS